MQRRRCVGLLAGCAVSVGLAPLPALTQTTAAGRAPQIGSRIVPPSVSLLDGRTIEASHWQGRVLVIELWATWCPICAKVNPHLDALHRRHRDKGLEVLGLSIDKDPDTVRRYMNERRYQFHAAMFDASWEQAIGRPRGLPILWVIDRESKLVRLEVGELFPEDVEELGRLV